MYGLLKKNMTYHVYSLCIFLPLLAIYWKTSRMQLDQTVVLMQTGYMYYAVLVAIISTEIYEERSKGYEFLATLPVTAFQIVSAKFILALFTTAIYASFTYFMFSSLEVSPDILVLGRAYLLVNVIFCLLVSAFVHMGFFRFGFGAYAKVLICIAVLIITAPILLEEVVLPGLDVGLPEAAGYARRVEWPLVMPAGLAAYLMLMAFAVKVKRGLR